VYSLVGGKWTTFRAFSEKTADKALAFLGKTRSVHTQDMPIGGGRDYPRSESDQQVWIARLAADFGLDGERAKTLFERYGTRAQEIATFMKAGADAPLTHMPDYTRREIQFLVEREQVARLDDLLLRRSLLAMLGQVDGALLEELGALVGASLGWSPEETRAEIERSARMLVEYNGVRPERVRLPSSVGA
jgi:glycerol-3-phosphate dehydrogenase